MFEGTFTSQLDVFGTLCSIYTFISGDGFVYQMIVNNADVVTIIGDQNTTN